MKSLEYKVVALYQGEPTLEDFLNRYGRHRWQLCFISGTTAIFSRELDETLGAGERAYQERELAR